MRLSHLFGSTLRAAPAEAEITSHKLLLRAGFIRPLAAGIYTLMPLGFKVAQKIEQVVREEMDALEGQEMSMPVIHPAELWQQTGRWYDIGPEMGRFKDRAGRDMVLAMTHEEVIADLCHREIQSYKQLPMMVYHFQTKFRDEARPRAGLIRVREFVMKDAYSMHSNEADLDRFYPFMYDAYLKIFERVSLPVVAVKSDVGMMGGREAHEFMWLNPIGEDSIVICSAKDYTANRQVALFRKEEPEKVAPLPLEEVATPETKTIAALAELLQIESKETGKAIFYYSPDLKKVIFAVVRGDMEVNETKLVNLIGALEIRPATLEEIATIGAVPGYASPIGIKEALVVVDDLAAISPNLVMGANREGYHLKNVNYGRDYSADKVGDIVAAQVGDGCPNCGKPLLIERGVEMGNIFKLGTKYTKALGANFLDKEGIEHPVIMASYGIGVGRMLAALVEAYNDENGIKWPWAVAPLPVHLVSLARDATQTEQAEKLYQALRAVGIEALFDDREAAPGVKFKDADLIGLPLRLTISPRSLEQHTVEWKYREGGAAENVPLDEVVARVAQVVKEKTGSKL
ncbi:MAG: proline--tRNA ligase [Chloroflexi bacterium]|nr:proline--tRNA ligase [Chloroflexota bacterium]